MEAKCPPVAVTIASRPRPAISRGSALAFSQVLSMRELSAVVTASARSSSRNIPRVPVVPDVVATV